MKKAAKKSASKKVAKKAAKKSASSSFYPQTCYSLPKTPAGYAPLPTTKILVPVSSVVQPGKLQKGLAKARDEITDLIQEIVDGSTQPYEITEIEFAASFSADGKFMGFGVGGAATITFRIRPSHQA